MTCCVIIKAFKNTLTFGGLYTREVYRPPYCTEKTELRHKCTFVYVHELGLPTISRSMDVAYSDFPPSRPIYEYKIRCGYEATLVPVCYPGRYVTESYLVPPAFSSTVSLGWNAYAIAKEPILLGNSLLVSVANGVRGAFIGLGPALSTLPNISSFNWGLLFDVSGVKIFEQGRVIHSLSAVYTEADDIRISYITNRYGRKEIRYHFNNITIVSTKYHDTDEPLFPYALLYESGDSVLCASYVNLPNVYGTVTGVCNSALISVYNIDSQRYHFCALQATATIVSVATSFAVLSCISRILANKEDSIFVYLPRVLGLVAEGNYSYVYITLPSFTSAISDFELGYIPPTPTRVAGYLLRFELSCFGTTIHTDTASVSLSPFIMLGSEYEYFFVNTKLPSMVLQAIERIPGMINNYSIVALYDLADAGMRLLPGLWDFAYGYRTYIK